MRNHADKRGSAPNWSRLPHLSAWLRGVKRGLVGSHLNGIEPRSAATTKYQGTEFLSPFFFAPQGQYWRGFRVLPQPLCLMKSVDFVFLGYLYLRAAEKALAAIRTMLGCSVPSFGFCPCGAWGGTEKYASLNGSSKTCLRSNFVS